MSQAYVSYYYGGFPEGFKEWRDDQTAEPWLIDRKDGQVVLHSSENGKERFFVRQPSGRWDAVGWKYTPFGYGSYKYRHVETSYPQAYFERRYWEYVEALAYAEDAARPVKRVVIDKMRQKYLEVGLKPEDYDAYWDWHHEHGPFSGMAKAEKVKMFYNQIPMPQPKETAPAPIILHAEHVQAYRRNRANHLKALRRIAIREGQGRFRAYVLGNYGGACCITDLMGDVEAAHIDAYAAGGSMHPSNGLPMLKALHAAFDAHVFTITPDTLTVHVAPAHRVWLNIHGKQIADGQIWPVDRAALAKHHAAFTASQS